MYGTHRITVDQTITLNKKDCCTYICFFLSPEVIIIRVINESN